MAFTNDPTRDIDRLRIKVGDTDPLNEYLPDEWYSYYLSETGNNEARSAIEAAKAILVKFTSNTREKVDQHEVWGNQNFDNYLKWLKEFTTNPLFSGLAPAVPFGGGTSKSAQEAYHADGDLNMSPVYQGFHDNYIGLK